MSYATLGNTEILKLPEKWWICLMMVKCPVRTPEITGFSVYSRRAGPELPDDGSGWWALPVA